MMISFLPGHSATSRLFPCLFIFLSVLPACRPLQSLGKNPSAAARQEFARLPNYSDGAFCNLYSFPPDSTTARQAHPGWLRLLRYLIRKKPAGTRPDQPLPSVRTDLKNRRFETPTVIWFGHSSFLLKTPTANLLFDPNFSGFAGPFRGLINAFPGAQSYRLEDLPPIDALVISHDHHDHLDYQTVKRLRHKVKLVIVPKGVGSHFRRWGYPPSMIREVYWHETVRLDATHTITATPAHHRSNRTMAQNKTLWASFVIQAGRYKLYFSGDTGYSPHFTDIGSRYGPFDLALVECGQYNTKWSHNHLFPEQSAQAALDLKARRMIPIHWAKFAEAEHRWNEPVERLLHRADSLGISVSIPLIGQPFSIGGDFQQVVWWK